MSKLKILIVEDDKDTARMTGMLLETYGYEADITYNATEALAYLKTNTPTLILMDVQMPGMNGIELSRKVRSFYSGGIIMLTAQSDEITELSAFNTGVDDFVTKPMRPHMLLARIQALVARLQSHDSTNKTQLSNGSLNVDLQRREVFINEVLLELTDAEFDIFTILAEHNGEVVSRDTICESLRGFAYDGLARFIDVRISNLRRKLASLSSNSQIKTVRGTGYMLLMV